MALIGRTERRLALAILLTAVLPLVAAMVLANVLVSHAFRQAFSEELGEHLDRSLGVYKDLVGAIKEGMRHQADAIAAHEPLRAAALLRHEPSIRQELDVVFPRYQNLVSLGVADPDGVVVASRDRGRPVDEATELRLEVRRPLGDGDRPPQLVAVFVTSRARVKDELAKADEFVRTYHQIERARVVLQRGDLYGFAALLGGTMLVALVIGTWLARGVTRRLEQVAGATHAVAAGDLSVRVPEEGRDEVTDLARAFNRMLGEVEGSRARIEFLQRIATWQEMARRLAHEIKNPLTPIQLAVEECHRKYPGGDAAYRKLLDTTLEVVEEEVATLRRLVGEFSAFARLPRAELREGDLGDFLRDLRDRLPPFGGDDEAATDETAAAGDGADGARGSLARVARVAWSIPDGPMPAAFDRQMLRRVIANLARNAAQAIRDAKGQGTVRVTGSPAGDAFDLVVDDDGPGVPEDLRATVFDPYMTTKRDGTGLGLAIVKKIVVEHGGTIDVGAGPLGGARFRVRIPRLGSAASRAAIDARRAAPESGRGGDATGGR